MMSILGAGVKGNTMIDLICDGQDELAFMDELKSAFADGFGESGTYSPAVPMRPE
ncbi:HPr family phosphocarrier protein, partial [Salmonella enterica subsp. enterica serovar Kentucky]|nr:HPr family phosphocarrier protein [Salmonella enterica subsp. enterica serovar Kentucky]